MNVKSNEMSQHDKDEIFGVKEAPDFSTDGLGLRYETEVGQEGAPDYLRQRVYCDGHGNYSITVKGGGWMPPLELKRGITLTVNLKSKTAFF